MLLGGNRVGIVLGHALDDLNLLDIQLKAAMGAFVGADLACHDDARLLCQPFQRLKDLRRDAGLVGHALDGPGAVAKDGKEQLAALTHVVQPATQGNGLALMRANFGNGGDRCSCGDFRHDRDRFRELSRITRPH